MLNYLIRRALLGLLTLAVITFIVYGLIRNMPGTPLTAMAAEADPSRKLNPEDLRRMEAAFGLDKPWYIAYWHWMGNLARGDLGTSISHKKPVARVIGQAMGPTLMLSAT